MRKPDSPTASGQRHKLNATKCAYAVIRDGKLKDGEVLTYHNRLVSFTRRNHSAESYKYLGTIKNNQTKDGEVMKEGIADVAKRVAAIFKPVRSSPT